MAVACLPGCPHKWEGRGGEGCVCVCVHVLFKVLIKQKYFSTNQLDDLSQFVSYVSFTNKMLVFFIPL